MRVLLYVFFSNWIGWARLQRSGTNPQNARLGETKRVNGQALAQLPMEVGSHCPWRCSQTMEMWHWGTWSVAMVEWAGVGLDDLSGLSQPWWSYECKLMLLLTDKDLFPSVTVNLNLISSAKQLLGSLALHLSPMGLLSPALFSAARKLIQCILGNSSNTMRLNTIFFSIKPSEFELILRGVRLQSWGVERFTNLL